jgi:hypothetical protein
MDTSLIGVWTYRSFYNIEATDQDSKSLLLAEGEIAFDIAEPGTVEGRLSFRSTPPDPADPVLVLTGSIQHGAPQTVRFQGVGIDGTAAAGWIYDYIGYVVPMWPAGMDQVATIVGSVTRTVSHPGGSGIRPGGATYSFVMVKRQFVEPRVAIPLPDPVRDMLATRHHRLHHFVWHGTRNGWTTFSDKQKKDISARNWAPARPAQDAGSPIINNGSGEDFLFMHRQMILMVQDIARSTGAKPIPAWKTIPPPSALLEDPDFGATPPTLPSVGNPRGDAVPAAWINPDDMMTTHRLQALKSDTYYWSRMKWWDRQFKDPQYLAQLSLGQLGSLLEWTVHNDMHMRWASTPRDPDTNEITLNGRDSTDIRAKWDNPKYDFLGEQYSSHVNPVFWRLHGWVDARIDDWFAVHELLHKGQIVQANVDGVPWFKTGNWVSVADPWVGPAGMHGGHVGHHPGPDPIKTMEEIVQIMYGPPPAVAFSAKVTTSGLRRRGRNPSWF